MSNLTLREQKIWNLHINGESAKSIANQLNLRSTTVHTYLYKIRKKLSDSAPKVIVNKKTKSKKVSNKTSTKLSRDAKLKRCQSFSEFKAMMKEVNVLATTLRERVAEFKYVYCKVCIYPTLCNECPTKILMNKYLELEHE